MKYAFMDEKRTEPFKGGRASCSLCGSVVIAKCGIRRVHHWSHNGLKNCDRWKENETVWHRTWKDKFPAEWQEISGNDESGERHIADVRTKHGLVIEFQHSHLDPEERKARERFHKNMVWVVDGTRLKKDYPRFLKGINRFKQTNKQGHYFVCDPENCFPSDWLDSPVSVIFDFLGVGPADPPDEKRDILWCLHPRRVEGNAVVIALSRSRFVDDVSKPPQAPQVPTQQIIVNQFQQTRQTRGMVLSAKIPRGMIRMLNRVPSGRNFRF